MCRNGYIQQSSCKGYCWRWGTDTGGNLLIASKLASQLLLHAHQLNGYSRQPVEEKTSSSDEEIVSHWNILPPNVISSKIWGHASDKLSLRIGVESQYSGTPPNNPKTTEHLQISTVDNTASLPASITHTSSIDIHSEKVNILGPQYCRQHLS